MSLIATFQYKKQIIMNIFENQVQKIRMQQAQDDEFLSFRKIYEKYNYCDSWIDYLKFQYCLASRKIYQDFNDTNDLSKFCQERNLKIIKREPFRFPETHAKVKKMI